MKPFDRQASIADPRGAYDPLFDTTGRTDKKQLVRGSQTLGYRQSGIDVSTGAAAGK